MQNAQRYGGYQPPTPPAPQPGGVDTPLTPDLAQPMRIVLLAAGVLVFQLIGAFATLFNRAYETGYQLLLLGFPVLLGCALCLLARPEGRFKGFGAGLLVLAPFLTAFTNQYSIMTAQMMKRVNPINIFRTPVFGAVLFRSYVEAAAVAAVALLVFFLGRAEWRKKVVLAAWISSGLILVFSIFQQRRLLFFSLNPPSRTVANIVFYILGAAAPALSVYPLLMLANLKPDRLQTGTGAKVWLWFCVVVNTLSVIITFPAGVGNIAQALVAAAAVAGYLLLIFGRRIGFPLLLVAVGMSILANLRMSLMGSYVSVGGVFSALVGVVNPLITWAAIHKGWQGEAALPTGAAPYPGAPAGTGYTPGAAGTAPTPPQPGPAAPQPQPAAAPRQVLSFIATTGAVIDPTDPAGQQYANKLHAFAREQLAASSPRFAQWFALVQQQNTPHQVGFGAGQTKEALNAAFKTWLMERGALPADLNTAVGDTLFLQAGDAADPATGQSSTWCVYIYFY